MSAIASSNPTPPVQRLALSVDECAQAVGLSSRYVRTLIQRGQLRVLRVGRRVLVPIAEVERFARVSEPEVSLVQ